MMMSMSRKIFGARETYLARVAISTIEDDSLDDAWVDHQISLVSATREEYESVLSLVLLGERPSVETTIVQEAEEDVIKAVEEERIASMRVAKSIRALMLMDGVDWDAISVTVGLDVEVLKSRAVKPRGTQIAAPKATTFSEAARILKVDRSTVHRWARDGKLEVVTIRGRKMVALGEDGKPTSPTMMPA